MAGVELGGSFGSAVVVDPQRLAAFLRSSDGPLYRMLIRAGDEVKAGAQRRVGVWKPASGEPDWSVQRRTSMRRAGTLRDSIVKRVVENGIDGIAVIVGSEDPIALWHHEGTQPHVITPRAAPQLVFWSGKAGRVIRTSRVQHPGTRPNRYLVEALADLRGKF